MGQIYQINASDKLYIMGIQTVFQRPFQLGDWTDLVIGGFCSGTSAGSPAANVVTQTLVDSTLTRCFVGLKDSSTNLPMTAGSKFAGWTSYNGSAGAAIATPLGQDLAIFGASSGTSSRGIVSDGASATISPGTLGSMRCRGGSATSTYAQPWAMRFQLNNWGTGSQSITITLATTTSASYNPYGITELKNYMLSPTGDSFNATINAPTLSRSDLSTFYIRWPFTTSRWRISCIGMERIS